MSGVFQFPTVKNAAPTFYYAKNATPAHLKKFKDKVMPISNYLRCKDYEKLQKASTTTILISSCSAIDRISKTSCDIRKLYDALFDDPRFNVAINMHIAAMQKIHIELQNENFAGTSYNVCAVITDTEQPDEIISFCTHFDSVYLSVDMYDTMSGSLIIMKLLCYFAFCKHTCTIRFSQSDSEEQDLFLEGMKGKTLVAARRDKSDKHVLMISTGIAAPTLGQSIVPLLSSKASRLHKCAMKDAVIFCKNNLDICSSGCILFDALCINYNHDHRSNVKNSYLNEKALDNTLQ